MPRVGFFGKISKLFTGKTANICFYTCLQLVDCFKVGVAYVLVVDKAGLSLV